MPTYHRGRHEHGQNFLTDHATLATITDLAEATSGPIIEIGPGDGAITRRLVRLDRPLTVVEIDRARAVRLERTLPATVEVVAGDFLTYRLPRHPHVIVGNLPFHQTTAVLRRLLHAPGWTDAVLLVQWEVARRRAGVGGGSMMTAQWAPWFAFGLAGRIPRHAFRPQPSVDGGLLTISRRATPRLDPAERRRFHALVHRVHSGRGRGLAQILARTTSLGRVAPATAWLAGHGLRARDLPGAMGTDAWVDLHRTVHQRRP